MSTPAENVTEGAYARELHVLAPQQLSFEGTPVGGITDTLKSLKAKPADKERHHFQHVKGWFAGRVIEVKHKEIGEGTVGREHIIEVLEWGTEE